MTTVTLKLPDGLDAKLRAAVKRTGSTKSELTRRALEAFLSSAGLAKPGSCLELANDLAGCLRGPKDLSNKKKHLAGYGR